MVQNPPEGYQRVIPYLLYKDAPAAIEFLCKAFGFEEKFKMAMPDGKIGHAEVSYKDNVVMLATTMEEMGHASQQDLPGHSCALAVYVDGVDAHFEHAKSAGAQIVAEPEDQFYGDRTYRARDTEGHNWTFLEHVQDIAPEDMKMPEC